MIYMLRRRKYCGISLFILYFTLLWGGIALAENKTTTSLVISNSPTAQKFVMQTPLYNLKAKIKIKEIKENTYWEDRERIAWNEEYKNWKFGFLENQAGVPPLILFGENFSKNENQNFYWVNDGAKLLVINPQAKESVTRFIFFAKSLQKDLQFFIYVNEKLRERKTIAKSSDETTGFTKFIVEDVLLIPGKNEVAFYSNKIDKRKQRSKAKIASKKALFVQLKDDVRFETRLLRSSSYLVTPPKFTYVLEGGSLNLIVYNASTQNQGLFLMSRELDINLEEYPISNFAYEINDIYLKESEVFLGIDYNGDGKVDGYLNTKGLRDVNLLELARNKWRNDDFNYYPSFSLKQIFLLFRDKEDKDGILINRQALEDKEEFYGKASDDMFFASRFLIFRLNNFNFYSDKSLMTTIAEYKVPALNVDYVNCRGEVNFIDKDTLMVTAYFKGKKRTPKSDNDSSPFSFSDNQQASLFDKELKERKDLFNKEYIELTLPIDRISQNGNKDTYLSFKYKLYRPNVQAINILLGLDNNDDGLIDERIDTTKQKLSGLPAALYFQKNEINLSALVSDVRKIRSIIFKFNKKKDIDEDGWYIFYMKDKVEIFRKYSAVIKSNELINKLLVELNNLNLNMLNIDQKEFRFPMIKNTSRIFEDGVVDFGSLRLKKGDHKINLLDNNTFKMEWVYLEAVSEEDNKELYNHNPQIMFQRINQAKYIAQVKGAKNPFWLVFLESYHPQWKIFLDDKLKEQKFSIVKDYKLFEVKEARYQLQFNPLDLKYIFAKPLTKEHSLINFYANGWYIDPKKLNLPEDFSLVLYFWPQYLYNIGMIIAGVTLFCCIFYLILAVPKKKAL